MDMIKIYGVLGVVTLMMGFLGWLIVSRDQLKSEVVELGGRVQLCEQANKAWAEKTEQAQKAMERVKAEAEARAVRQREAERVAARAARDYELVARTIQNVREEGAACQDVARLIEVYRRGRS